MSWRVTVPCTRAQGEMVGAADDLPGFDGEIPVLVADEPDETKPDDWLIHAYFEHHPTPDEIASLSSLGSGPPQIEQLGEDDWVTMSQAGLQPIRAGSTSREHLGRRSRSHQSRAAHPLQLCDPADMVEMFVTVEDQADVLDLEAEPPDVRGDQVRALLRAAVN